MRANLEEYLSKQHQVFVNLPFKPVSQKHRIYSPYSQFLSTYHNLTSEYINPLNNISLCAIPSIEYIEDNIHFMSRDGLMPLLDFMLKFETPNNTSPQIAIYKPFVDFIPESWSDFVIPFEYSYNEIWTNNIFDKSSRENLLITVYPCDFAISIENVEKTLNKIDRSKYKNVYIFVQYGHSFFKYHDEALKYSYKIINSVNKFFNLNTEIVTEKHLFGKFNLKHFDFLELNHNGILWSDNILTQRILFLGARPYFRETTKLTNEHFFHRQSLSHGLILHPKEKCGKKLNNLKQFLENLKMDSKSRILDQKELCSFLFGYLENEINPTRKFFEF